MSWRIILISKPSKLSLKNHQLLYEPSEGDAISIPIEDISVLILESPYILLTTALLSSLIDAGAVIFSCAENHIPNGALFPYHQHSRYSEISSLQKEWTEPFKKRIWQEIIKTKILNQAYVLKSIGNGNFSSLLRISKSVQSGDANNQEAVAARIYWENLFDNFIRGNDDWINSCLNYGYAILRGAIARSIVGAGLLPCFGVNHSNGLNAFNLADDIIEPFRPFVDIKVYQMAKTKGDTNAKELSPNDKQELVKILTTLCIISEEKTNILTASDTVAFSIATATRIKDYNALKLPYFILNK